MFLGASIARRGSDVLDGRGRRAAEHDQLGQVRDLSGQDLSLLALYGNPYRIC